MVLLLGETRICGSTIGKSVTANLYHVCLDNQSHYSLDIIEAVSEIAPYTLK